MGENGNGFSYKAASICGTVYEQLKGISSSWNIDFGLAKCCCNVV